MQLSDMNNAQGVIDLTDDEEESKKMKAKVGFFLQFVWLLFTSASGEGASCKMDERLG